MISREDFMAAYGAPDESFDRAVEAALDGIRAKEAQPIMKKKLSLGLLAAIIAILTLTGAALAVSGLGILDRIFTSSEPDEKAAEAVMHVRASDSCPYGMLTVTDCVLAGEDLYVEWRFDTDTEENLVVQGDLRVYGSDSALLNERSLGEDADGGYSSLSDDTALDLRGAAAQTRRMKDGSYASLSKARFGGGMPDQPFEVARTLYLVRPLGDVASISAPIDGYYDDGPVAIGDQGMTINLVDYDGLCVKASLDWFSEEQPEAGGTVWIDPMNSWGETPVQGEVLAVLEARFTVDPATLINRAVAIDAPRRYDCGDFELEVTKCEFTGFDATVEYELFPQKKMSREELNLWHALRVRLPDGTTPAFASVYNITKAGTVRGILWSEGGFAVTPEYIELIPLQYVLREDGTGLLDAFPHEEKAVKVALEPMK